MKQEMRTLAFRFVACLICICLMLPVAIQSQGVNEDVEALLARMSPTERVGQLFVVGFPGDLVEQNPALLELIQKYRIGGVVLSTASQNFSPQETSAEKLHALVAGLQGAALSSSTLSPPTPSATIVSVDGKPLPSATAGPTQAALSPTPRPVAGGMLIPLFVALQDEQVEWLTDESGLQPILSLMAIGATWNAELAEKAGMVVGETLSALGINMLLGPSLDLSNQVRAGLPGDLNAHTFGESPFWVSVLAEAYVHGLRIGSEGSVLSIAAHFPGWGASDRDVYEEIPIMQGSLENHLQTDLLPFRRLVSPNNQAGAAPIDGLLVSHVQFRAVTSSTQMTRPASFDPQGIQYFLSVPEVKAWRAAGGLTVSDLLGTQSVRRLYDPQEIDFQAKRIAYDAFLAGNDLLCMDAMGPALDDWEGHFRGVREALEFFHSKYTSDSAFRSRVDDSVRRILAAKLRLYGRFSLENVIPQAQDLQKWAESWQGLSEMAGASVTLVYPKFDEMVARIPAPPEASERIAIFEDIRLFSPCTDCDPAQRPVSGTTFELLRQLYGQQGSGHVDMQRVRTYTLAELWSYLTSDADESEPFANLEQALTEADWLLFLTQPVEPGTEPESNALNLLLRNSPDLIQGKRIIVIACGAPYYMDSTDIAKVSAFYAVYSPAKLSIEAGLRALFREFAPTGRSPVSIPAVQYSISERLQPAADQMLYVEPLGDIPVGSSGAVSIGLGDELTLTTGLIKDQNGELVPDGIKVTFLFSYPAARIAWQKDSLTVGGQAQTSLRLDTSGTLEVRVISGEARNTATLVVTIAEDKPTVISTVVPTPSPTQTPTATPPPIFAGESEPASGAISRPLDMQGFLLAFLGLMGICAAVAVFGHRRRLGWMSAELALLVLCAGMGGYLVYAFMVPRLQGAPWFGDLRDLLPMHFQSAIVAWVAGGIIALIGCWRPSFVSGAVGLLRRLSGAQYSQPNGQ